MDERSRKQSDLRTFLREAEGAGKLYHVKKEVDPRNNMGTLSEQSDRTILFENVAGYKGWTVVANLLGNRDLEAIALNTTRDRVLQTLVDGFDKGPRPVKLVDTAPVKEVIWRGDDANMNRLPIVTHSELDAGPYIGSGIGVVRDPETRCKTGIWVDRPIEGSPRTVLTPLLTS